MEKLLNAVISLAFLFVFASPAYSEISPEECAADADCVSFYNELGGINFKILKAIRDNYVDEIAFQKLIDAFRSGGLKAVFALLDPHSGYKIAEERAKAKEANKPFGGVGMKVRDIDKKIIVFGLVKDGPAAKSGKIKKGDILIGVGDKSIEGLSSDVVIELIRGDPGTDVVLKLRRENALPAEFVVILRRELILPPAFLSKVFGDTGYIFLPSFEMGASAEIYGAIKKFPENVKGLVFDLRGNPGGLLTEANKASALFLELKQLIGKVVNRENVERLFTAGSRSVSRDQIRLPLVVLVNEFSASASEIFAAAMQDNRRAVIIGMPTFGKALVQSTYGCYEEFDVYWAELLNGDCFQITTARIYRANDRTWQGKGVIPDIIILSEGEDDIEKMMLERVISERALSGHLKGEEEGMLTPEEKSKLDLLKDDRQLYVALEVLRAIHNKEKP